MAAGFMTDADDLADTPCAVCLEPIAAGQRFYQANGWTVLGHAGCVEDNLDRWDDLIGEDTR